MTAPSAPSRPEIAREEAWGRELEARQDWRGTLAAAELTELEHGLDGLAQNDGGQGDFPAWTARGERIAQLLEDGPGVYLLRGLPVQEWGSARAAAALRWLGQRLGTPLSQSASGERVFHVRDEGFVPGDQRFRGPSSNKRLRFHTDRCDVIGFLCLRAAREGGENQIVSSPRIHEELARAHPELLAAAYGTFPYLRHTVDRGNALPYVMLPLFSFCEGRFAGHMLRVLIERAAASEQAPDLSALQLETLDAIDALAETRALQMRLTLQPGELLFLNNWTTFHRRTEFLDSTEPEERRHLLRIWLSMWNSRGLVESFRPHFGAVEPGALRGGMRPVQTNDHDDR